MAETEQLTGRQFLFRIFARALTALVVAGGILYLADVAVLRYRIFANRHPFDTVTVRPYYAVPRKDQKTELMFDNPRDETCVNSMLPHLGHAPCWYLRGHPEMRIDM